MADSNFVELLRATVQTLEDLLGGNEPNTQVYTEQCKAMVHEFVQVRNSLPTLLEAADGVCSALIFKELYCLACGAVRILKLCCEEQSWLQAVILLKVHTRNGPKWSTFEMLRDELDWCINILRGNIDASTSTGIHVDRLTHRDRETYDEENLRQKLRNAVESGTPQEVSIANFLLPCLDVNNGQPLDPNCRCIQQLNCWLPETVPLIYLIEGPVVGPRVSIRDGEISSVSSNLTWFGINVARKAFRNGENIRIRKRIRKQWEKEAHFMAALTHPNVVSFIGCSDGNEGPAIIMEGEMQSLQAYIDNKLQAAEQTHGHLQTAAETRRRAAPLLVPLVTVVDLLTQIASGMAYLHSQDIAHLDLKLANLLITSHTNYEFLHVKIADFGESIRLKGRSGKIRNRLRANLGTTVFRAPELFRAGRRVCFKAADVCSFGFTAWAILHCHEPRLEILHYRGEEEEPEVEIVNLTAPWYYDALVAGNRLGFHDTIPEELQYLVNRCWDTNPDTRPPFSEIYYFLQSFKAKLLGSHVELVPLQERTAIPRSGWPGMLCLGSRQGGT